MEGWGLQITFNIMLKQRHCSTLNNAMLQRRNNVIFQRWNNVLFQRWNNVRFQRWNNVRFQHCNVRFQRCKNVRFQRWFVLTKSNDFSTLKFDVVSTCICLLGKDLIARMCNNNSRKFCVEQNLGLKCWSHFPWIERPCCVFRSI